MARPDVLLRLARHHARLAGGRRAAARAARACGRLHRGGVGRPRRRRPPAARLPASTTWSRCTPRGATVRTAVERYEPRALIVSSTTAAMLLPRAADAVRGPLRRARPAQPAGRAQRVPARARAACDAARARRRSRSAWRAPRRCRPAPPGRSSCRRRSIRRAPDGAEPAERERLAVAYVPDPKAKGLDVLVAGWAAAARRRRPARGLRARSRAGRARTCAAPACRSPRRSTCAARSPAAEFRARLRRAHALRRTARAGRTGARRRSRRWRTARCSRPCPPAARTRACGWRASSTTSLVAGEIDRGRARRRRSGAAFEMPRGAA